MLLYESAVSGNCYKIRLLFAQLGIDYERRGRVLRFPRRLTRDRVSGWRWLVGAFGIGTYRQDDSVDVRYERDGRSRVASLAIEPSDEA